MLMFEERSAIIKKECFHPCMLMFEERSDETIVIDLPVVLRSTTGPSTY